MHSEWLLDSLWICISELMWRSEVTVLCFWYSSSMACLFLSGLWLYPTQNLNVVIDTKIFYFHIYYSNGLCLIFFSNYCGIIPFYTVKICCCDWFNKGANWPIAGQNKLRWENQTKDTRKKKGGGRGVASETWRGNKRCKMKEKWNNLAEYKLINMVKL